MKGEFDIDISPRLNGYVKLTEVEIENVALDLGGVSVAPGLTGFVFEVIRGIYSFMNKSLPQKITF